MPNFGHLHKFLEDFKITQEVSGNFQYTYDEVYRALLICVIIGNGLKKRKDQNFGERVCEILHFALNSKNAHQGIKLMEERKYSEKIF